MSTQRSQEKLSNLTNLLSSPRKKASDEITRQIYLNNPSSKNISKKLGSPQGFTRGNRSVKDMMKEISMNIKFSSNPKNKERLLFSDRKSLEKKITPLNRKEHTLTMSHNSRFGKNKIKSSQSGVEKGEERSTMISALLSNTTQKSQKHK